MKVVVVGAGKMGLPLACQLAERGATVTACDANPATVALINEGRCPIEEPGVAELLSAQVARGALSASTETASAASAADVVIVIVPALLTAEHDVDTSILESVAAQLAGSIRPGTMVSFETTMPVGGTRSRLLPVLESGGLTAGADFDLVFSPERVKSQSVLRNLTVNPKVVGGITPEAAARGAAFYATYLGAPVQDVGTLEAAEMVKLAGMVYRDVNIALSNELARYGAAVGVDLLPLLDAINADGEAAMLLPGIGVGGHCTPVYPHFLIRDAERRGLTVSLPARARLVNDAQPAYALDRLEEVAGPLAGRRVMLLGLAFRPQVREHICSPTFDLDADLRRRGAEVVVHDPLYTADEIAAHGLTPAAYDSPAEVVVLVTAHPEYVGLDPRALAAQGVRALLDGRDCLGAEAIRAAGIAYVGIGQEGARSPVGPALLPVAVPRLGHDEAEAAADVVRSGWVMQGPEVAAFEAEFAEYVGARHACAVSSGTAALHLALLAVGVGPGTEVVTVSHSFVATANAVRLCGAEPVLVDIAPGSFNLDVDRVARSLTERTAAIVVVHQYGMPCDLAPVLALARRHGIPVVEDAACAAGSEIRLAGEWERIGRPHGDAATFSFHPRKVVTTGEGGMVVTATAALDERVRLLRQHGTLDGRTHLEVAPNYRMSDIHAALGRRQLRRLDTMLAERRRIAARYTDLLGDLPGLAVPAEPAWARSNWQSYCVVLDPGLDRDRLMGLLREDGIDTRPGIPDIHHQPAYADLELRHPLPHTETAAATGVCLPLFAGLGERDQDRVAATLAAALETVRRESGRHDTGHDQTGHDQTGHDRTGHHEGVQ